MEEKEYKNILKYLKEIIPREWNSEKIRKIKKEFYEERLDRLCKRNKEGKLLQILKKDEIEAIMFMTHSHSMGDILVLMQPMKRLEIDIIGKECMEI